jgi:hypothetical protein
LKCRLPRIAPDCCRKPSDSPEVSKTSGVKVRFNVRLEIVNSERAPLLRRIFATRGSADTNKDTEGTTEEAK